MINSTFRPSHKSQFRPDNVLRNGQTVFGSCEASSTSNIDLTMTDDHLLTGGSLLVKNGKFGDKITLQVVHPVAGVVRQFETNRGIASDKQFQFEINEDYPAALVAGLTLRAVYVATAEAGTREVALSFYLHMVLI